MSCFSNNAAGSRRGHLARLPQLALIALAGAALVASLDARAHGSSLVHVPSAVPSDERFEHAAPWPLWPDGRPVAPDRGDAPHAYPIDDFADGGVATLPGLWREPQPPRYYLPAISWLGLRHSYTHGRNVGFGRPLVGTSWLNRPYYIGGELGTLWVTRAPDDSVSRDTDLFGGLYFGWDWDHYWGGELRFDWATPELVNRNAPDAPRGDSLFVWSYSYMYYPWGDATWRPYWRLGIGNTKIDFPLDWGARHDEWMLTVPVGIGVKYPLRRHVAARIELTDHVAIGQNHIPTLHNLTLTVGLEGRFGVRPKSYWPWYPSRHIW